MGNTPGAGSVSLPSGIIWYRVPSQTATCDTYSYYTLYYNSSEQSRLSVNSLLSDSILLQCFQLEDRKLNKERRSRQLDKMSDV